MAFNLDGWRNFFTKAGVFGRDKRLSSYADTPCDLTEIDLSNLYHGNDIAHRIARAPAKEMTRAGIKLTIEDGDPTDVMQALDTMRVLKHFTEAVTWARLYGGALIFVGADDGQSPDMPLNMDGIKTIRFLSVLDRHEVSVSGYIKNPLLENYGEPEYYRTNGIDSRVSGGALIHHSRVIRFDGTLTARRRRRQNAGWADSVFTRMYSTLRGYGACWDSVDILIQDFSQAVYKIKNLTEIMAANGEDTVLRRMELNDTSRSVLRAMVIDADKEDFERKATPMTGLPEVLQLMKARMASAAEMPVTLLFGTSAEGLNATGEGDANNWYSTVAGMQDEYIRSQLERFFEILFRTKDGPTKGVEPQSWSFDFNSLKPKDATIEAQIRKTTAETDQIYIDTFVLTAEEVAQSRFSGDEFNTDTTLADRPRELMETRNEETDLSSSNVSGGGVLQKVGSASEADPDDTF